MIFSYHKFMGFTLTFYLLVVKLIGRALMMWGVSPGCSVFHNRETGHWLEACLVKTVRKFRIGATI